MNFFQEAKFDALTMKEILESGRFGFMFGAKIHITHRCPPGCILVVDEREEPDEPDHCDGDMHAASQ